MSTWRSRGLAPAVAACAVALGGVMVLRAASPAVRDVETPVHNGGFEQGGGGTPWVPAKWTMVGEPVGRDMLAPEAGANNVHRGNHALFFQLHAHRGIRQGGIRLEPGRTYELSLWARKPADVRSWLFVQIHDPGGHVTHHFQIKEWNKAEPTEYTKYHTRFSVPKAAGYSLILKSHSPICVLLIDDIRIVETSTSGNVE